MGRTALMFSLLVLTALATVMMLYLLHAQSELSELQGVVENHRFQLASATQASSLMAEEIKLQSTGLDNVVSKTNKHQNFLDQQQQRIAILSDAQRKTTVELAGSNAKIQGLQASLANNNKVFSQMSTQLSKKILSKDTATREELQKVRQELDNMHKLVDELIQDGYFKPAQAHSKQFQISAAEATSNPQPDSFAGVKPPEPEVPVELQLNQKDDSMPPEIESEMDLQKRLDSEAKPGEKHDNETNATATSNPQPNTSIVPALLPELRSLNRSIKIAEVVWFRECGCTGMEIEAVTLLTGLRAHKEAKTWRIMTNRCDNGCNWPNETAQILKKMEVDEDELFPAPYRGTSSQDVTAVVVHAAFLGVCGMSETLEKSLEGPKGQQGMLLISRSMVEADRLEPGVAELCNTRFDSVWVPSVSSRDAFRSSEVASHRLRVLPEAVDTKRFHCGVSAGYGEAQFGIRRLDDFLHRAPRSSFTFLSSFKWEDRKNWQSLLKNFAAAFPSFYTPVPRGASGTLVNVSVRLLIKTQVLSWSTDPLEDIPELMASLDRPNDNFDERLLLVTESLSAEDIAKLYKSADAFVLPTHGEGWGLPLMEAMASGLPTIATGWGGHMGFMSDNNSWPVAYDLVEVSAGDERQWAEPKSEELQKAMMEVVAGGVNVSDKAARGCSSVAEDFAIDVVAGKLVQSLESLLASTAKLEGTRFA